MIQRILYSPFFHFIILGACIFIFYNLTNKNTKYNKENQIIIDENDLQRLIGGWQKQWNRPPNANELTNLTEDYIKQEIYYREALKLKLDHNDEIVRRRLSQKMEFLHVDLSNNTKPTDTVLLKFYLSNKDKYVANWIYNFYQICLSADKRKNPIQDAKILIAQIKDKTAETAKGKGDITVFPFYYAGISSSSITAQLGSMFADSLPTLETGKWVGPIASSFGQHLVFIEKKTAPETKPFYQVKDKVLADYQQNELIKFNQSIYDGMKKNYIITIETSDTLLQSVLSQKLIKK